MERLDEALREIAQMARSEPALAAEGAVLLLEKLSPAICEVDSSSGALGTACARAVEALVPMIVAAPVPRTVREAWLDRLFDAFQDDDPPYIESLGPHWGALCAEPSLASHWADKLLPMLRLVLDERRQGTYAYTKGETPCLSALFHAGRFDELLALLALYPKPSWHEQH